MSDPRRATAHHEAGHAAMALLLGRGIDYVSIRPGPGESGHVLLSAESVTREDVETEILVFVAGPVAEGALLGERPERCLRSPGARSDVEDARRLAERRLGFGVYEVGPYLDRVAACAGRLLGTTGARLLTARIANALLEHETLTGDEVAALARRAAG